MSAEVSEGFTGDGFKGVEKPSTHKAAVKVAVGVHKDPQFPFKPVEGFVRKEVRPDIVQSALQSKELIEEQMRVVKARYFQLLMKDVPLPEDFVPGVNWQLFAEEFKAKGIPLPAEVTEEYKPGEVLKATLKSELVGLLPELARGEVDNFFDHGEEVKGDPNSKDILERMKAVQVGPIKTIEDVEVKDPDTGIVTIEKKEVWVNLGVKAFDLQFSHLAATGVIPPDKFRRWQEITRLKDFRMRIFVTKEFLKTNEGSLAQAIKNAGVIFKGEMGWLSCLETMEQIPELLAAQTGNGIVVTYDMPGQFKSAFRDATEVVRDPFLETVQGNNFAVDASLHLLGFDREEIDSKFQVTIGHSKEAVAQFYKTDEMRRKDRGFVCLAPVPEQKFLSRAGLFSRLALGAGLQLSDIEPLTRVLVRKLASKPILRYYIGSGSEDVKKLHRLVLQEMDLTVASRLILRLLSTRVPQIPPEVIADQRIRIFVPTRDKFIDINHVLDKILGRIERSDIVRILRHGHYTMSYAEGRMKGDPQEIEDHRNSRSEVVLETMQLLQNLSRVNQATGTRERWRHPNDIAQLQDERVIKFLAEEERRALQAQERAEKLDVVETLGDIDEDMTRAGVSPTQRSKTLDLHRERLEKQNGKT